MKNWYRLTNNRFQDKVDDHWLLYFNVVSCQADLTVLQAVYRGIKKNNKSIFFILTKLNFSVNQFKIIPANKAGFVVNLNKVHFLSIFMSCSF